MGSISRIHRCERFRKELEEKILAAAAFQPGDILAVVGVTVGMTDDGSDVSRLFVTAKNLRTHDEVVLSPEDYMDLFVPEAPDEENVSRLQAHLFADHGDEKKRSANRKKAIKLLKDAELIDPKYKDKP